MTQYIVQFILTSAECDAIKAALITELPLNSGEIFNPATKLYQNLSEETDNALFKWAAHEAHNLLDRLLVACPELAVACGLYRDGNVERYPSWRELKSPGLLTACSKVLESLGYALPR